jgi:hypothetical protein
VETPLDEMYNIIDKSLILAKKGVAFNFINEKFIDGVEGFNTFDPKLFYDILKEKYNNTTLITNYLGDEDFTIYFRKDKN